MSQSAAERPDPTLQRKAAIAFGGVRDFAGKVEVRPIPNFDLDRTIFQTLEGKAARYLMTKRVGKEPHWTPDVAADVQAAYEQATSGLSLPEVDAELLRFLVEECDFDVEHADGSFLDHLYFCYEYSAKYYPDQSPLVMLLHSILGTGTNTFAMTADKIPALRALMSDFDWRHTEAFPSVLRLLYAGPLREELRANLHRLDSMREVRFHRVIDDAPITMTAEDFWIALNYQLIHLVDFLPVANWAAHQSDTSFILFRDLDDLLIKAGKKEATIAWTPAEGPRSLTGEKMSMGGWLTTRLPVGIAEKMAARSVTRFSERIGHSLSYEIRWA